MNQQSSSSLINNNLIKQNYNSDSAYNQVRISPVFDANFGLPTASMAEMAFNGTQSKKYLQTENCSTQTLSPCFNSSINTLTSKSNLVSDNKNLFNRAEQSMEQLITSASNSIVTNFNNLLNDNSNSSSKINFIDDYQNVGGDCHSVNNINAKLQNFEHVINPSCSKSINYDNFNTSVSDAAANFNLTAAICQTPSTSFNASNKNSIAPISNSLNATSLASAIVAAANVAAQNHFQHEELLNILNAHNGFATNQLIGINEQNLAYNLQDLVHSHEMIKTSINVHQILNQSIANANSNDMFKSATTTMGAVEIGSRQTNYQTALLQTAPNNNNVNPVLNVGEYSENNNNNNKIEVISNNCLTEAAPTSSESTVSSVAALETSSAFRPIIKIDKQNQLIKSKGNKDIIMASTAPPTKKQKTAPKPKQSINISENKINETLKQQINNETPLTTFDDFVTMALNSIVFATNNQSADTLIENGTTSDSFNSTNGENQIYYLNNDGKNVLLCQVCSDRASGFHYGINSCEGCKGFFRRSIQQKIQYKPCTKSQQCLIVRANRNRCQDCRFKKCLAVGMSRDAVRFGRVPKREKVKIAEELQRASIQSQMDALSIELEDESALIASIENGFKELGAELHSISEQASIAENFNNEIENETVYYQLINAVAKFSKRIHGFHFLYKKDCINLLKSAIFQILLLRFASLKINFLSNYSTHSNNVYNNATAFSEQKLIDASIIPQFLLILQPTLTTTTTTATTTPTTPHQIISFNNNKFENDKNSNDYMSLHASTVEFVNRFRSLELDESQTAIFAALVLCQPDSAGSGLLSTSTHLQQAPLLKMVQQKLWFILQTALFSRSQINAITGSLLNQSIFAAFTDLRALNTRYQEHLQNIFTINTGLLNSSEFEQKIKCIENKNISSEINFNLTKKNDSIILQKLQTQNDLLNTSMLNLSNVEQTQTTSVVDAYNQTKNLIKTNLIKDERKRSSSSPPLSPKSNLYMQTTNSNIYQTNQQNLYSTIATSSASQHDLLAALAVVATSKEFAQFNGNVKDTNSKVDSSIKLPTKNNYFITNTQGDESLTQNHLNGELKPVLEQSTPLMAAPPTKRFRLYENEQSNYVSLKESHKEIASLLESPSPLIYMNQQQQQQQQQHQQQQHQQQNCNVIGIEAVNSQFQNVNDSTNLCNNLILTNENNINKSQIIEMSPLISSQKFDVTSIIMDQIRQQLSRFPNQNFNNNFNTTTTTTTNATNTATAAANATANALKNYCFNTDDEHVNRLNNLNNFSDEPLNLCIREQY